MRYALIDYEKLKKLLNFNVMIELAVSYGSWLEDALKRKRNEQDSKWTPSAAMGSESYVTEILERLGYMARGLTAIKRNGALELWEPDIPYNSILGYENMALKSQNWHLWDFFGNISIR